MKPLRNWIKLEYLFPRLVLSAGRRLIRLFSLENGLHEGLGFDFDAKWKDNVTLVEDAQ